MTSISTGASASCQSKIAYLAAALFTLASGGTNLIYGWQKGADLAGSLVWASVSLGVSVVFALAWPAFIISLDRRQWSRAAMVFVALIVTGTYSVSAALGSASSGRMSAAAEQQSTSDAKRKAEKAYDAAQAEIAGIPASRPASELQVLIGAAETELTGLPATRPLAQLQQLIAAPRFSQDCAAVNGSLRVICPRNPSLQAEHERAVKRQKLLGTIAELKAELARSERRQKLTEDAETAAAKVEKLGPAKIANTDAAALATYLQALGFNAQPDTINRLLVLLAVVTIECGGGLALAVGMALNEPSVRSGASDRAIVQSERALSVHSNAGLNARPERSGNFAGVIKAQTEPAALNDSSERGGQDRVIKALTSGNGVLFGSQARLASTFSWSKTRLHQVLHELEAAGRVRLSVSSRGTAVQLLAGTA